MPPPSDNSEPASRRRVSATQLNVLWEFLNSNRDVALGHNKAAQAREYARRKWSDVATNLNAQGEGAVKDWKGWSKYWVDYKAKLKRRAADVRASQNQTGGGPSEVPPLSEIEKKFLLITGQDYGLGMSGVQVELFDDTILLEEEPVDERQEVVEDALAQHDYYNIVDAPVAASIEVVESQPIEVEVQQPAQPVPDTQRTTGAVRHRRLRRRTNSLTQEAARQAVVESSRIRAEAATGIVAVLEQIARSMTSIDATLSRIEARLPSAARDD